MGFEAGINETLVGGSEVRKQSLQDIRIAEPVLMALIRQWSGVEFSVLENRKMRRQRVDLEALRAQGKLTASEKYIGVRVIDNNIQKDIPPYISYLKQSRRQAIFKPVGQELPTDVICKLEDEFSTLTRYQQWEFDFIRWIDGSELHGYDWIETLYDGQKPGKVANNHIGAIDLIFDLAVKTIQDSRVVMRRYRPTLVVLDKLAQDNGFDPKIVKHLRAKIRESLGSVATESPDFHQDGSTVHIYKVMYKERGVVFVAWFCPFGSGGQSGTQTAALSGWLREPRLFWNGIKSKKETIEIDPATMLPVSRTEWVREPEKEYPYHILPYKVTEDQAIAQTQGRGEMDLHIQEASCSTWSAFVNQCWESSRVMWSPSQPDPTNGGTAPKQLSVIIKKGAIWDRPMTAFTPPPPNPMVPKALEMLATQNADNINQTAWTVNNRQDSRKTAREIDSAEKQQSQISSTQVVVLSVSLQSVFNADWRIIQSQALQGNIPFLSRGKDETTGLYVNDEATLSVTFQLYPAGDVDYVERMEQTAMMQQDWPVIQQTGARDIFMEEYLRVRYPKTADRYIAAIKAGDQKTQLIQSMGTLLKTAVTDETGNLRPEWQPHAQELASLEQAAQQLINPAQPNGNTNEQPVSGQA